MKSPSPPILVSAGLIVFSILLFRVVLPSGTVIQSMDYNYGLMAMYKAELPGAFFTGFWRAFPLLGKVGTLPLTFPFLTLAVLPLEFYMDWIYTIHLLLASAFLLGFLRLRGLAWVPACAGTLVALWLGNNLTLIHPGHLLKYGVLLCATGTLFSLEKLFLTRSWRWAVVSGGWLGWMFMHQADVALFSGLILGAYTLFRLSELPNTTLPTFGINLALLLAVAGLMTWENFEEQMDSQVRNAGVLQSGDEQATWNFATQWSFPPSESMDLIAPGFWGWSSVHEQVPYHGVTGQSPDWESSGQGLPNLRLESPYLGILGLGLAIIALLPGNRPRKERIFWAACALLTMLFSFGNFAPFYRLIYQLPLISSIRNPNKFLQVFQLCVGILAGFGLENLLQKEPSPVRKWSLAGFGLTAILLGGLALTLQPESVSQLEAFAGTLWESSATNLLQNRRLALLHAALFAVWTAGCLFLLDRTSWKAVGTAGILLALLTDSALLSRHYLKPDPVSFLQENALADFLTENLGHQRVAVLQPDPLHDYYLSHLFPAHHIAFADIRVAPRLEQDYQDYFEAVGNRRLRMWREFGVKYILAPRPIAEALIQQTPALRSILLVDWSYNLTQSPEGILDVHPAPSSQPGNYVVMEFTPPSDRFMLLNQAVYATREQALSDIASGAPSLVTAKMHTPGFEDFAYSEDPGIIDQVLASRNGFLINVCVYTPKAILRLADRHDPRLRARVNGQPPQPLQPMDVLFTGIVLPPGIHQVEIQFKAFSWPRMLQIITLTLWALVLTVMSLQYVQRISRREPTS